MKVLEHIMQETIKKRDFEPPLRLLPSLQNGNKSGVGNR